MTSRGEGNEKNRPAGALMLIIIFIAACFCSGCHSPLLSSVDEQKLRATGDYRIIDDLTVPPVTGAEGCGAQALATVLAFDDPTADAAQLGEALPWHDVGATPIELLLEARRRGHAATIARGDWDLLAQHVLNDRPVLVMIDATPEVRTMLLRIPSTKLMHWAVVSGMALDEQRILLGATDRRHRVVQREDFLRRWARSDNCLIVVEGES